MENSTILLWDTTGNPGCARYMGYWPSVQSRWLDIGQSLFLRVYGPMFAPGSDHWTELLQNGNWIMRYCNIAFLGSTRHGNLEIAHCRNVRALGRVSYIDQIENLNIKTEMLMKSYPTKFKSFLWKIVQMGTLQKLQNSIQTLIIFWPGYPIHTNSLFWVIHVFVELPFCHFSPPNTSICCI